MGVSTHFYTIHGIKIDCNKKFNKVYDSVYDDADTPFILMDGMGGKYMIFGNVLFDSGDMRWGFEDGDVFVEIDTSSLTESENEYKQAFIAKFPEFADLMNSPFKLYTFAHYS
jgi:hypothetical protein